MEASNNVENVPFTPFKNSVEASNNVENVPVKNGSYKKCGERTV